MPASLSTHVLDTALGRPAAGLAITLEALEGGIATPIGQGVTDADGRVGKGLLAPNGLAHGVYRLTFETGAYLTRVHGKGFYPVAPIVFEVSDDGHHHVPLLLSPYGLATYRGS